MHYKDYFINSIRKNFPVNSAQLIMETENHFSHISKDTRFAATSKNPIDRRLNFSAYFLALVQTLNEHGETFERIREICLEIVIEYVKPKNRIQQFLKKLPPKLIGTRVAGLFLKLFDKKVSQNANPNGFIAKIITDKNETYGFGYGVDIMECGICKLFKKHDYEKYASILCEVDKVTSGLAGLELIRSGTIANGAAKCDFRFRRIEEATEG
ncbi:L-2-amino-thiazoline-4-carboxylic acid hydrolase [Dyadobacter sp. CY326]|uniref:L-2-amino-thiazoline-4-carboxylic acid hydrolase n=1 Tax=Dyadobacter sp. CY326 TaxID=2907300 RepID=UPI001F253809|nr:L-2-amino-thiazoline-4-carboxylic acid hydrolase [Dyadobacter sp. CY326]MCE7065234.1 L-2-amino-thiazoline-4-carboxylic acid hydrolase [Dyadobacter sp. CY326]